MIGVPIDDKKEVEVRMRVLGIVSFLVFFVAPVSLYAQPGGGGAVGGLSSITTGFGDSFEGVQNVSELGGFIGGGRPTTGFVGTTEIYNTSSSRGASTARQNTVARTVRPLTTATAQRRAAMPATRGTLTGTLNTQAVRSVTSIDANFASPSQGIQPQGIQPAAVAAHLNRVPGIQDSQVTFTSSPMGTTAVLTGTVASDTHRRVAQQLLLMEPGINRVENLLEIR